MRRVAGDRGARECVCCVIERGNNIVGNERGRDHVRRWRARKECVLISLLISMP